MLNTPLRVHLVMLAGRVNEQHRAVHAYLREENRVLRELHGRKRLPSCSKTQPSVNR